MNKAILLGALGIMALSVTGCNTCCEQPCCPPAPAPVAYGYGYDVVEHQHHPKHHKHHKHHPKHHKQPVCNK